MRRPKKLSTLFLTLGLTLSLLLGLGGEAAAAGNTESPYAITVDRTAHVVTVYGLDGAGGHTVPVKKFLCSVGMPGSETPLGSYQITTFRRPWLKMVDGSYGQYAVQFYGNYLFHSVCYARTAPSTLTTQEYNDLGKSVSHGCVRLQTGDAKWIFDNCPTGTCVTILDGPVAEPLDKPVKLLPSIDPDDPKAGWDPTDPREENPWREWLKENTLPYADFHFGTEGYEDVLYLHRKGIMRGDEHGCFSPDGKMTRIMAVQILFQLSGQTAPAGTQGGVWYLPALGWATQRGLVDAAPAADLYLEEPITRQELAVLLYRDETLRLGHSPAERSALTEYPDGADTDLFAAQAVGWALGAGVMEPTGDGRLLPEGIVHRLEGAQTFARYARAWENI